VTIFAPARSTRDAGRVLPYSDQLVFWLNGEKVVIDGPDPSVLLVDYLHSIGLVGTKVGCGQGGCGACTVMVSHRDALTGQPEHRAVNSCLRPLCAVDGMMVTTVEGIGSVREGLDPVQHGIAANNGTQCGFCTPGFVMNAHAFLQQNPSATEREIEDIFGGNLCRCTGYRPILHGVRTLACDHDATCDRSQQCVADPTFPVKCRDAMATICLEELPSPGESRSLHFSGGGREWYRPVTLDEVQRLKAEFVELVGRERVKLVFGNTA
jgi:xanthine dehydrogenase/oxidase